MSLVAPPVILSTLPTKYWQISDKLRCMKIAPEIRLSSEERRQLKELVSKGVSPARVQTRARVLLMAAEHSVSSRGGSRRKTNSNQAIAEALQISGRTVSRIRQRFMSDGLEAALYDQARPGRPVEIDGEAEAKLVMLACSAAPEGRKHWTLQLLADRMVELGYVEHISDTWVMKRLKKTNLGRGSSRAGASRK
jgi:transposase